MVPTIILCSISNGVHFLWNLIIFLFADTRTSEQKLILIWRKKRRHHTSAVFTPTVPLSSSILSTSPLSPPTPSRGIFIGERRVARIPLRPATLVLAGTPKAVTIHWQEVPRSISRMRKLKAPSNHNTNYLAVTAVAT